MKERKITVTFEKAKEWYNSGNVTLQEIALQAFSKKELNMFDFTKIKTFKDALIAFNYTAEDICKIQEYLETISFYSEASAAMSKLNIIREVLNLDYDFHLTKNSNNQKYTWYPYLRFITKDCTYYDAELKNGVLKKIGTIISEGIAYDVLGGDAASKDTGLGCFSSDLGVGYASADTGFLGCATEEIAKHFGFYFGTLIMEAMYADLTDFHISK